MRTILNWSVNGFLFLFLAGLLVAYPIIVGNLPARVYTAQQSEFLSYTSGRTITQDQTVFNVIEQGGQVRPAVFSGWQNQVQAHLHGRYEEQDGVVAAVYDLDFTSHYTLTYSGTPPTTTLELIFPFPRNLETLHEVRFMVDGREISDATFTTESIRWEATLESGQARHIVISYKANGANGFSYGLNRDRRSDLLSATITVSGLVGSDIPRASLPLTEQQTAETSETFTWRYQNLVANRDIQLNLPTQLSFAQRVAALQDQFLALALLAPFLVTFFLFALAAMMRLGNLKLQLPHYLLIGCVLALFYPTLTFLSGLLPLILAASLALAAVAGLILLFLTLTVGWPATWWRAGFLLFIFLGLFSLGILTPWWGLLMSTGGLLLVGALMVLYARRPEGLEFAFITTEDEEEDDEEPEPELEQPTAVVTPPAHAATRHCPRCARTLSDDYEFCPACGYDVRRFQRCGQCGQGQLVPVELEKAFCVQCGQKMSVPLSPPS